MSGTVYVPKTKGELVEALTYATRFRPSSPLPYEEGEADSVFVGIRTALLKRYGDSAELTAQFDRAIKDRQNGDYNSLMIIFDEMSASINGYTLEKKPIKMEDVPEEILRSIEINRTLYGNHD